MRIYLPSHLSELTQLRGGEPLHKSNGLMAYAVSETLRQSHPDADEEDLEYEAQLDAAFASIALGAGRPVKPIVISADISENAAEFLDDTTCITVTGDIKLKQIVAIHVGEIAESIDDATDVEPELLWFDASELQTAVEFAEAT